MMSHDMMYDVYCIPKTYNVSTYKIGKACLIDPCAIFEMIFLVKVPTYTVTENIDLLGVIQEMVVNRIPIVALIGIFHRYRYLWYFCFIINPIYWSK